MTIKKTLTQEVLELCFIDDRLYDFRDMSRDALLSFTISDIVSAAYYPSKPDPDSPNFKRLVTLAQDVIECAISELPDFSCPSCSEPLDYDPNGSPCQECMLEREHNASLLGPQ